MSRGEAFERVRHETRAAVSRVLSAAAGVKRCRRRDMAYSGTVVVHSGAVDGHHPPWRNGTMLSIKGISTDGWFHPGGERSRNRCRSGRSPIRPTRTGVRPPGPGLPGGRAAPIMLGRRMTRRGVSVGSLTIASNSARSHSSSSQTNTQKVSSAPEPSAGPVISPSVAAYTTPRRSSTNSLMYARWCRFGISNATRRMQEDGGGKM